MEINSLFVVIGGVLIGAALVWLLSRMLLHFRPRPERERVIRLEVRARTLHEHVHHAEGERPYTAEEVGDVLFGSEAGEDRDAKRDSEDEFNDERENREEGRRSED